jgi:hypothetical protein
MWDRWCCIVVALSACAPVINLGCAGDSEEFSSCISIFKRLLEAMGKLPPKNPKGMFEQLLAKLPEEPAFPTNPILSEIEEDNESLPAMEIDGDDEGNPEEENQKELNEEPFFKKL